LQQRDEQTTQLTCPVLLCCCLCTANMDPIRCSLCLHACLLSAQVTDQPLCFLCPLTLLCSLSSLPTVQFGTHIGGNGDCVQELHHHRHHSWRPLFLLKSHLARHRRLACSDGCVVPRTWRVVMEVDELTQASHPLLHSGNW